MENLQHDLAKLDNRIDERRIQIQAASVSAGRMALEMQVEALLEEKTRLLMSVIVENYEVIAQKDEVIAHKDR